MDGKRIGVGRDQGCRSSFSGALRGLGPGSTRTRGYYVMGYAWWSDGDLRSGVEER